VWDLSHAEPPLGLGRSARVYVVVPGDPHGAQLGTQSLRFQRLPRWSFGYVVRRSVDRGSPLWFRSPAVPKPYVFVASGGYSEREADSPKLLKTLRA